MIRNNIAELEAITTLDELDRADLSEFIPNTHIIIGSNGRCMCGIYDNKALSCAQILSQKSEDIRSAMKIAETGEKPVVFERYVIKDDGTMHVERPPQHDL